MSKTISMTGNPPDIDGSIAVGVHSLEQRIHQAFRFRLGEWFLRTDQGVDYDLIFKHQINFAQVAQVLTKVVEETGYNPDTGANEVRNVTNIFYDYDPSSRRFIFSCNVDTVYGTIAIQESF